MATQKHPQSETTFAELVEGLDFKGGPPGLFPVVAGLIGSDYDHVEICLAPANPDVYETLIGLIAPSNWDSVVVAVEGTATRWFEQADAEKHAVSLVLGVHRDGSAVSRLDCPDESSISIGDNTPGEGLLLDCAQRVFGLATPPPPASTTSLQAALWTDLLLCASLALPTGNLNWPTAAALHPAAADVVDDDPVALAGAAARLAAATTWASLRACAANGERLDLPVTPEAAGWMDDGLFARWCLAQLPHPDDALRELSAAIDSDVVAKVRTVIDSSGA